MELSIFDVFWIAVVCSVAVYVATRWAPGMRTHVLIGCCVIFPFLLAPWWATLCGTLAGFGLALVVTFRKRKDPIHSTVMLAGLIGMTVGIYSTVLNLRDEVNSISQKALKTFEEGNDADRFVATNYVPCLNQRSQGDAVCKASTLTIASKAFGDDFAKSVANSMERWDVAKNGNSEDQVHIERIMKSLIVTDHPEP